MHCEPGARMKAPPLLFEKGPMLDKEAPGDGRDTQAVTLQEVQLSGNHTQVVSESSCYI